MVKKLVFRVFKKRKIYWQIRKFIEENYVCQKRYGVDRFVEPKRSAKSVDTNENSASVMRYSREPSRIANPEACPAHAVEEEDRDFQAVFDIFNRRRPDSEQDRIKKVEQLMAAAEKKEKFTSTMLRFIVEKGLSDADVYNKVFMDRRLFNHIRNDPDYQPSKRTALLIAVSLKLTYEETQRLLETAGFTLTHSDKRDLIVEFFIREGNYNIFEINEMLEQYKQPLLMKCK